MNWENLLLTVAIVGGIYAILSVALNLQFGHGGLINFGIVAYFAAGAYSYVIITQPPPGAFDEYRFGLELPMWAGFLGAGAAGILFAVITGGPCLRLRGEYLALTTFAFAEVFHSLIVNQAAISNGTLGFSGIDRPFSDVATGDAYRYLFAGIVLGFLLLVFLVSRRLVRSPYGRTLRAIRDDETAAQLAGKPIQRYRLSVFLFSALLSGFAGALYVWYTTIVSPQLFTAEATFAVWIALVIGGVGSNVGAVAGALILIGFEELIRQFDFSSDTAARVSSLRVAATGVLLIVLLRFRRGKDAASLASFAQRFRSSRRPPGAAAPRVEQPVA